MRREPIGSPSREAGSSLGERAGTLIAGRFVREDGLAVGIDHTNGFDPGLDYRIGAEPEGLLDGRYRAQATLAVGATFERQDNHLERVRALVAAGAFEGDDHDIAGFEDAMDEAADQPPVLVLPERREGEALELAAINGTEPRSRQPENRLAARVLSRMKVSASSLLMSAGSISVRFGAGRP